MNFPVCKPLPRKALKAFDAKKWRFDSYTRTQRMTCINCASPIWEAAENTEIRKAAA